VFKNLFTPKLSKAALSALDMLDANVMFADMNFNITYMNKTLIALLRQAEPELRKPLPRFSVDTVIGSNLDMFEKNVQNQRDMMLQMEVPYKTTIQIGQLAFDLKISLLKRGARKTGFVVEWLDAAERLLNMDNAGQVAAINRTQAVIEFATDGTILYANENFLKAMGYTLAEVKGKHHRIFVDAADAAQPEYQKFWQNLGQGKSQSGEFKRHAKGGGDVWIHGSYNPVFDKNGNVLKVVKFVTDVTARVTSVLEIGGALSALAAGDLERRLDKQLTPELEKIRADFNHAMEALEGTMKSVGQTAQSLKSGSNEISASSEEFSRRTEQQAAGLEETAASLEVITETVRKTAENVGQARNTVAAAKKDAEASGIVLRETETAMSGIETSSRQIGSIIGVIDEIAFQTNLLALNAGVEAARAGDAGRGFAVVATEVRALAQRSADAAKEIKTLVSGSSQQVEKGVKLVAETGKALDRIVEQVMKLNILISDVAVSAQEQATRLQEVNAAMNQMDQVTQKNAAMIEESTAASHNLSGEAEELTRLVGQFNLGTANAIYKVQPAPLRASLASPAKKSRIQVHAPRERALAFSKNSTAPRPALAAPAENWNEF
jgi:methyl-accepting chemotaxis protein